MNILDDDKTVHAPLPADQSFPDTLYDAASLPSLVSRIKALFIDLLFMLMIFTVTSLFIELVSDIPNFAKGFILFFMFYLYDPVLTAYTGSTIGHKAMKLKVRRYGMPDKKLSLARAVLRFLVKGLLGWISFLTVTSSKNKRAIHDLASGSILLVDK